MRRSLGKRIFFALFFMALITATLTGALVSGVVYARTYTDLQAEVRRAAHLASAGIEVGGQDYLTALGRDTAAHDRVTRIAADGTVLFDSAADPADMENHASRPEIAAVRAGAAYGEAVRLSATLGQQTYYYALPLPDGTVLRVSTTTDSALSAVWQALPWLVAVGVLTLLLTLVLAQRIADALVEPLNTLDPANPQTTKAYDELSPLVGRLHEQNRTVHRQLAEIRARQEEFRILSSSMDEGLLMLGLHAEILSVNRAACTVLGGDPARDYAGEHLLRLSRALPLQTVTAQALAGNRGEGTLETNGRLYQILASPILVGEEPRGALVLLLDVTERQAAERLRREFSANVSHELKTPLTSISGYAEMIAGGLVRPEDVRGFAGRIHREAGRLLALIEDIMKLSRLDEGGDAPAHEPVELLALARQAVERLELRAQELGVTVRVAGEKAVVSGVYGQLFELIFNLTENAVKYNRVGGSVTVTVQPDQTGVLLTVADTGIGIPADAQGRVFERFFRVDKSRSKETGGTGLGLSIVKHVALLHGAKLTLESEEGRGTTVRVRFAAQLAGAARSIPDA